TLGFQQTLNIIHNHNAYCNSGSCGLAITKANPAQTIENLEIPNQSNFFEIPFHTAFICYLRIIKPIDLR
ncbi:hypothetical protein, partial [Vibrio parahaemolyticus]